MTERASQVTSQNQRLAELLEELTDRVQRGEQTWQECSSVATEQPEEIQSLIPVLQLLEHLDADGCDGPRGERDVAPWQQPEGTVLDDFRIIREIGRGGMGVVYEAEQISLQRPIALKVLPSTAALDATQIRRFENEVRATAALDHPNIVPIYAVGNIEQIHYYAMQLIKGRSLAQFIAERRAVSGTADPVFSGWKPAPPVADGTPRPRRVLASSRSYFLLVAHLGIQAAQALQHAHDAGIVHRDVKPSNLLVSDDDHLWVSDFGLARIMADSSLTDPGGVVGTMRYMSPEQALGRSVIADHRGDIYSLGTTLYELAALQPAFPAPDRGTLLKQISHHEILRPCQIDKSIPRDLETIILKAMAEEPQERYDTAQELADDLQRFQEDRPIVARRPSLLDRAAKTARRNAPLVWSAMALLAVIACALAAVVVLLAQQRDTAQAAAARERQLAQAAQHQEARADRERRRAEDNFVRARQAVDRMFHSAVDELTLVGGSDKIRHDLLEDALKFYQGFLQQKPDNDAVRYDLAVAYARVGEIHHRLGHADDSEAAIQQARALLRALADQPQSDPKFRLALARVLKDLSHVCLEVSDHYERSAELIEERVLLLKALVAEYPAEPSLRRELAGAHTDWGKLLADAGRTDDAETHFHQSLALWNRDSQLDTLGPRDTQALAPTHHALGSMLLSMTRFREAKPHLSEALRLQATLAEAGSRESRARLAHVEQDFATLLCKTGVRHEAESHLRRAIATCEQLVEEFPDAVDYAYRLSACHDDLYRVLLGVGRASEAHESLDVSSQQLERLSLQSGGLLKYVLPLARNWYISGSNADLAGDAATAEVRFAQVHQVLDESMAKFPNSTRLCSQLAWFLATCPDPRWRDAERAQQLAARAVQEQPQDAEHRRVLAAAEYRLDNCRAALEALEQSAELKRGQDGFDLLLLALCHARLGDRQQAEAHYGSALGWLDSNPCDAELLAALRQEAERTLRAVRTPSAN